MRRPLPALLAGALLAVACGRFAESTSREDRGDGSAGPPASEGGPPPDDAANAVDASFDAASNDGSSDAEVINAPTRECFAGAAELGTWQQSGAVTATAFGLALSMTSTPAVIWRAFSLPGNVRRSRVELASSVARSTYGTKVYADVLAMYLGDTTSYRTSPTVALELLQSSFDVNTWFRAGGGTADFDGTKSFLIGTSYPPRVEVERVWATGAMVFETDAVSKYPSTPSTARSAQIMVTIGGMVHEGGPPTTLAVREICVDFD